MNMRHMSCSSMSVHIHRWLEHSWMLWVTFTDVMTQSHVTWLVVMTCNAMMRQWGTSHGTASCLLRTWIRVDVLARLRVLRVMMMSHVTCDCVMSSINKSWQIWLSHVVREHVTSHMHEACHQSYSCALVCTGTRGKNNMWIRHVTCEWVMSRKNASRHIWMHHATVGHSCT